MQGRCGSSLHALHRAQAVHTLVKDERRLREERESFQSRRQEYAGFSRGDMLTGQGSCAGAGSASLRRSVRPTSAQRSVRGRTSERSARPLRQSAEFVEPGTPAIGWFQRAEALPEVVEHEEKQVGTRQMAEPR